MGLFRCLTLKSNMETKEIYPGKLMTQISGWIGFDFDGTLVTHEYPLVGKNIQLMVDKLKALVQKGIACRIFTARTSFKDITDVQEWCMNNLGLILPVTNTKDMQMIKLYDDRAIAVESNTGKILGGIEP